MKTVLSCCTAKVFARALLPMTSMSAPPQAAAENDNKVGSVPKIAWSKTQDCTRRSPTRFLSCLYRYGFDYAHSRCCRNHPCKAEACLAQEPRIFRFGALLASR